MKNFISKFNKIYLNYNYLYLIITFLFYVFYASATNLNFFNKYFYIVLPLIILIFFLKKSEIKKKKYFEFNLFSLNKNNLIILTLLFSVLLYISSTRIFLSIAGDELAYSTLAFTHSNLLIDKVFSNIKFLENFNASFVIRITSLIICIFTILFFFKLFKFTKNSYYVAIFFIFTFILLLRYLSVHFGGNNFPHPPFVGFTPLIFTSL